MVHTAVSVENTAKPTRDEVDADAAAAGAAVAAAAEDDVIADNTCVN